VSAADTSGQRAAQPETFCAVCAESAIELHRALRTERRLVDAQRCILEQQDEARFRPVVSVLAIIGGATVILALVCLAVLALRLAGGAR
jgi:hypothetical protein